MVKFRVAWRFKHQGRGSSTLISTMLLNIKESCDLKPLKNREEIVWSPPTAAALKFNVDSSTRGNLGNAGIGAMEEFLETTQESSGGIGRVLQNACGKVLCMFSLFVGSIVPISAEVHSIHKACSLIYMCQLLNNQNITILSDSESAVAWINGNGFGHLSQVYLIYDIRQIIRQRGYLAVQFTPRCFNSLTNNLANARSTMRGERLEWSIS
ncbi:hypothetical protein Ddye_012459 [Dipteronia dyeriana]|uniref:RNase H type-1 domain-containing protein n=1 Tax=Dipteronia dyeriana TaxID=168575 RepID=A0AAE0CJ97_9ROSI|nr:hypothetical protein Ddye_012459 [Dipteronia dyeriana]